MVFLCCKILLTLFLYKTFYSCAVKLLIKTRQRALQTAEMTSQKML